MLRATGHARMVRRTRHFALSSLGLGALLRARKKKGTRTWVRDSHNQVLMHGGTLLARLLSFAFGGSFVSSSGGSFGALPLVAARSG